MRVPRRSRRPERCLRREVRGNRHPEVLVARQVLAVLVVHRVQVVPAVHRVQAVLAVHRVQAVPAARRVRVVLAARRQRIPLPGAGRRWRGSRDDLARMPESGEI
jgi:hypothetical protein